MREEADLSKAVKRLEEVLRILTRNKWGTASIGGKYGELFVASKLRDFEPQVGEVRQKKSADVYLSKIDKRVEVKWGKLYEDKEIGDWWGWGFGKGSQIEGKKFDYCILLASGKNGKPRYSFVLGLDELARLKQRLGGIPARKPSCYLRFWENFEKAKKSMHGFYPDELETELNKNPKDYNERWDKIS